MVAVAPLCAPSRSGQRLSGLHRSLREACTLPARVWVHKVLLAVLIGCVTALVLTATTQTVRGNSRGSTWGRETSSSGVHFAAANTRYLHQSTNSLGIPGTPRSKHEHPSCAFLRSTNQQTAQVSAWLQYTLQGNMWTGLSHHIRHLVIGRTVDAFNMLVHYPFSVRPWDCLAWPVQQHRR